MNKSTFEAISRTELEIYYKAHEYSWEDWHQLNATLYQVYGKVIELKKIFEFKENMLESFNKDLSWDEVDELVNNDKTGRFLSDGEKYHLILDIPSEQKNMILSTGRMTDEDGFGTSFNSDAPLTSVDDIINHFWKTPRLGNGCGDEFVVMGVRKFQLNSGFDFTKVNTPDEIAPPLTAKTVMGSAPDKIEISSEMEM